MTDFTVRMLGGNETHDCRGSSEVYGCRIGDRDVAIDSWDVAVRAAWQRLDPTSGWDSAVIVGPGGRTARVLRSDRRAYDDAEVARAKASIAEADERAKMGPGPELIAYDGPTDIEEA